MLKLGWPLKTTVIPATAQPTASLNAVPGLVPIQSAEALLAPHASLLAQLDELAGVSKRHFTHFYSIPLRNFARFVQQLPASEVHHHAGLGGLLTHTLEVCVTALKIRRAYLLSETGGAEDIAAHQDSWTYAVFLAALCHDLAKVAVDQTVTLYDPHHQALPWNPWHQFMDEHGLYYTSEFNPQRQYRLHEKATPLLIHKIIPVHGMQWLTRDRIIFSRWLASLCGDHDQAGAIGEIIRMADSQSVAANLGADGSRMPTVKTIPLHEKMLTALRHLLQEGELPLNRNGAAGWIKDEYCWLVSKRTVDAIREHLTQEGHTGMPAKNGRLFDLLQEHGLLVPCGDKAIWTARIEGEGWSHQLTLIKIPVSTLWTNPERRPEPFDGRIVPIETAEEEGSDNMRQAPIAITSPIQPDPLQPTRQQSQDPLPEENDPAVLLNVLPALTQDRYDKSVNVNVAPTPTFLSKTQTPVKDSPVKAQPSTAAKGSAQPTDPVDTFFHWLQQGIQSGTLKTNQAKARVHVVQEGVALMTPGIFQDYALANEPDSANWADIQKKVLKKNWHVKAANGLNVLTYHVTGPSKTNDVNVVLFEDKTLIFGATQPPKANPHFLKRL